VAASAQESAGASMELTVQSQDMRTVVDDLVSMVGGRQKGRFSGHEARGTGPALLAGLSSGSERGKKDGKAKIPPLTRPKPAAPTPEQFIPLEEKEFDHF
jgi:hypothetical protein